MPDQELRNLLRQLNKTLDSTEQLDPATRELVVELDKDIDRLLDQDDDWWDVDNLSERATALETRFSAEHPVAGRFLREIVDMLAKVGI